MIRLFTGQPGHGKTQIAIREALAFVKEGRRVFVCNINDFDYAAAGCERLESFKDWASLPDNSVVVYDEAYGEIEQRSSSAKVPQFIKDLATHRHRGFDFILIAQQAKQLDTFISGLVDWHWHVRRKWGTQRVLIKKWDKWTANADKANALVSELWKMDPAIWKLYKSATMHTVKRNVPWYVFATPATLAIVVAAALYVPASIKQRMTEEEPQVQALASGGQRPVVVAPSMAALRTTDPAKLFLPREPGQPWTSPAYDGIGFAPPPRIACMSSETSCTCLTIDQGTRYVVGESFCRYAARHGVYDPTVNSATQRGSASPPMLSGT